MDCITEHEHKVFHAKSKNRAKVCGVSSFEVYPKMEVARMQCELSVFEKSSWVCVNSPQVLALKQFDLKCVVGLGQCF